MRGRPDIHSLRKWGKICGIVLAILMLRVWETVQTQRLEKRLSVMRLEADRLTYENGRLEMQIHQYEAPSHLEALAKAASMVPLDPSRRVGMQP